MEIIFRADVGVLVIAELGLFLFYFLFMGPWLRITSSRQLHNVIHLCDIYYIYVIFTNKTKLKTIKLNTFFKYLLKLPTCTCSSRQLYLDDCVQSRWK